MDFRQVLDSGRVMVFDGGMGTLLQAAGMPAGQSPEEFGLSAPDVVRAAHAGYRQAGAHVVTTNTFGATRYKLPDSVDAEDANRRLAAMAREAAGDAAFVAGSVGPTGHFVRPLGERTFRELVEAFKAQVRGLAAGGVDLVLCETHFDLAELRAAIVAVREVCDLPVGASMTFENGLSLTGTPPLVFLDTVQNMGVDLVASNCSAGPEGLRQVGRAVLPRLSTPLLLMPNAGLPELRDGHTVFPMGPEAFAQAAAAFVDLGAQCVGGCCGTTPEHIKALAGLVEGRSVSRPDPGPSPVILTSRSVSSLLGVGLPLAVIGERINPTGKKLLTEQLQAGQFAEAVRLAVEQAEAGASVLDVNVGAPMVDEATLLPALTSELVSRVRLPLSLDSTNADAIEAALEAYPGSALVNSITAEPGRMERLGPVCKKHGAPFILLPLEGRKLPVTAAERLAVVERLLAQAEAMGIPRRLMVVDALVLTVSSKPESAKACFEVIRQCRERWGLPVMAGLSNVSFGLPARELVNSTFLAMAMAEGMAGAIANPGSARLRESLSAAEVLLDRDPQAQRFIGAYSGWTPAQGGGGAMGAGGASLPGKKATGAATLHEAVVTGERDRIVSMIEAELDKGRDPFELVDGELIPGITEVGERYERKEYFLPQLLLSAETMQTAFARLKPLLEADGGGKRRDVVVMATVEGDIHDIGKNIVNLMLGNHGFDVVDLGKDVPAARIVDEAERTGASVIGLSALMTTTMVRMEETVRLAAERGLKTRVMVGGAVVSQAFADSIGAHGYSDDAVGAVKVAKRLAEEAGK